MDKLMDKQASRPPEKKDDAPAPKAAPSADSDSDVDLDDI